MRMGEGLHMGRYYVPLSGLIPHDLTEPVWAGDYAFIARKWDVSIFDWAELQSKHKLHISYTAGDLLLKSCNMEIAVTASSVDDARDKILAFHVVMYARGFHPFSVQLVSSYSINDYAGICSRKSSHGLELLPEGMRTGITSATDCVEVWPAPYASGAAFRKEALARTVTHDLLAQVVDDIDRWNNLRSRYPVCRFLERVLMSSPVVADTGQSLLHVWTGLESIFPKVQSEVSFRLALYLAQLQSPLGDRQDFFQRAKRSYGDRSKVAHGGELKSRDGADPWMEAWSILTHTVRALLNRQCILTEEELIQELLVAADASE
ncbi:hypothetical protein [Streptomyces sp. NPDC095613]|uniref:hypothetical protein n=1 Tax=Streptomyces sp. NPDC095613 TaxID=3155540 RepID=UPI003317999B